MQWVFNANLCSRFSFSFGKEAFYRLWADKRTGLTLLSLTKKGFDNTQPKFLSSLRKFLFYSRTKFWNLK